MKIYNNPEIKISIKVLVVVMLFFTIINYLIIQLEFQSRKKEYLSIMGEIVQKIITEQPELEEKIVPIITRTVSEEDKKMGIKILKQYGLEDNLELSLFPNLNQNYISFLIKIIGLDLVLFVLLLVLNYMQYEYFYRLFRNFTIASKNILDGNYEIEISKYKEGDVSKFAQSLIQMAEVLKGNIARLDNEKIVIANTFQDISHQLKTPLSTLILYNDIMLNKDLSKEDLKNFLKLSQKQLNRMRWLILNLLKLAKLDANAVDFNFEEENINETIEEVLDILKTKALEKNINLCFKRDKDVLLRHDRLWLQEALLNIIKNAIEHSNKNEKVEISIVDSSIYTRIIINNKGDIISEEDLPNIFKRFYKCKSSNKDDTIGIGLSLSKALIEKHGGYIEVYSNEQEGTTFLITFLKY
ncbi:sensor histidine kinase KdpD [Caloramator sp. ALD01]|uniref:sensor histidine kinase n=1 Tax=Caloramator sp. ALD01 TaxID=1031288 RepID=UPI00041B0275|nr:HAMP domain-containing sensor histidine kinase [Caloramator sp. ALD01]